MCLGVDEERDTIVETTMILFTVEGLERGDCRSIIRLEKLMFQVGGCGIKPSTNGLREKTGVAHLVRKRTRQMPYQLSWPLRDGCWKKCSSAGAVEAEKGI